MSTDRAVSWVAAPAPPPGVRVDPRDEGSPVFTAAGDELGALASFETQVYGRVCSLLAVPAAIVGAEDPVRLQPTSTSGAYASDLASIHWRTEPFGVSATVTANVPNLTFVAHLADVERCYEAPDLTKGIPVRGLELLSLHRWPILVDDKPHFSPDGESAFEVSLRRVLALMSSSEGCIGDDATWRVPLSTARPTELSLTLRWPIFGAPQTYPTHDGQRQWWRVITPPVLGDAPVPLIVGLHGACNAADNWLEHSHPSWSSSARIVAAMLLGCPVIVPNANDAASVESNPADCPEPRLYGADGESYVFDAIAEAARRFPIDLERVYLFGLSMGGHGALTIAARNPGRIAAVVAGAPPVDLAASVATFTDDDRFGIASYVRGELGDPEHNTAGYLSNSPLWLAENLVDVPLILRGSAGDELVEGHANVGALSARLTELGYPHDASITERGTHGDYETIEGLHDRALDLVTSLPRVDPSPDHVVFKTADLCWRRAHWVEIESLEGEWGAVDASRDALRRCIELRLSGIARIRIDLDTARIANGGLVLRGSTDVRCTIVLARSELETTFQLTPGNHAEWTI